MIEGAYVLVRSTACLNMHVTVFLLYTPLASLGKTSLCMRNCKTMPWHIITAIEFIAMPGLSVSLQESDVSSLNWLKIDCHRSRPQKWITSWREVVRSISIAYRKSPRYTFLHSTLFGFAILSLRMYKYLLLGLGLFSLSFVKLQAMCKSDCDNYICS